MTPKRLGMGDSGTIGGPYVIAIVVGPPVVGTIVGALVGGPQHRVLGGALGLGAGVAAVMAYNAYTQAKIQASMNAAPVTVATLKNDGYPYLVSATTSGVDVVALATSAGFHVDGSQPHGQGPIQALWPNANGVAVPAGLLVQRSAALPQ